MQLWNFFYNSVYGFQLVYREAFTEYADSPAFSRFVPIPAVYYFCDRFYGHEQPMPLPTHQKTPK